MKITLTPKDLAEYNRYANVYHDAVRLYKEGDPRIEEKLLELASIDIKILKERWELYKERKEMSLGDYIKTKEGKYLRVTVLGMGDNIQAFYDGSYHLGSSGHLSFSGTCGELFPAKNFKLSKAMKTGRCWIFHKGWVQAHYGIEALVPFKVWKEI